MNFHTRPTVGRRRQPRLLFPSVRYALGYSLLSMLLVQWLFPLAMASTTTTTPIETTGTSLLLQPKDEATTIHFLDLSYLHRCGVAGIARAIRGTLEGQDPCHPGLVDIDLTASMVGKNISELLGALQERLEEPIRHRIDRAGSAVIDSVSIPVGLSVRRNQLSPLELTEILEFVLANGPTNVTATTTSEKRENETVHANDETKKASEQKETGKTATADAEIPIADDEAEAGVKDANDAADDTDDASSSTADPSAVLVSNNSISDNDSEELRTVLSEKDGGNAGNVNALEEDGNSTTTAIGDTTVLPQQRPAFVSIQSLNLGWNHLGSSSLASNRRRRGSPKTLHKTLRKLLANPHRCPPKLWLDVCGLDPPACRDMAKGLVERYKAQNEDDASSFPPSLSLELARNEGIGDVGVAALAAAIRTVASPEGFAKSSSSSSNTKKKKRRKKKRKQQPPVLPNEEGSKSPVEEENPKKEEPPSTTTAEDDQEDSKAASTPKVISPVKKPRTILERLNLSGCDIGDVGAEALAIALANHPLCVRHLDLSNNRITDQGAMALARALGSSSETDEDSDAGFVETLDLSHNKNLGDRGAKELALAFQRDGISELILRSCNIRADGASCFGNALRVLGSRIGPSFRKAGGTRKIDLSGNPLGILSKTKKKSGVKYSATALKSKATDTTKAYMNIIGKSIQKGLNSISGEGGLNTLESDDEASEEEESTKDEDEAMKKCGALSLAEAFLRENHRLDESAATGEGADDQDSLLRVELGLRHCSLDTRASEALAAVLQESKKQFDGRLYLTLDLTMNHVLEDDAIAALHGEAGYDDQLMEMAEVYLDALEVLQEARERALRATQLAAARRRAEAEREAAWGEPPPSTTRAHFEEGVGEYTEEDATEEEWSSEEEEEPWPESEYDDVVMSEGEDDYSEDNW